MEITMLISLVVKELLIAVYSNWTLVGNLLKLPHLPFLLMVFFFGQNNK